MMTERPRILICGGHDYADRDAFNRTLDRIVEDRGWMTPPADDGNRLPAVMIVYGGTDRGVDALADEWVVVNWSEERRLPARWSVHGPETARRMIDDTQPHLVVAFPGAEADTVGRARAAGIEVIEVSALPADGEGVDR